jgi:chromate transporter
VTDPAIRFAEVVRAFARVAAMSFGGPAAQIAVIHRVAVDEKKWLDESAFLRALSFCMLLPGPEAQQLATYVGWKVHGVRGGLVAGSLFVLPGFVAMLVLSVLYVKAVTVALVAAILFGLKSAVLPVVFEAVFRLKRRAAGGALGTNVAIAAFLAIFALRVPFPAIIAFAAVVGLVAKKGSDTFYQLQALPLRRQSDKRCLTPFLRTGITAAAWLVIWLAPVIALVAALGGEHILTRQALFFSRVAVVTFGGAYAVLAYVAQQAVDVYHWLSPTEMLDGLGLAETTPGPLIMVVQFVAFLGAYRNPAGMEPVLAGVFGSLTTVWVTFAPSFMFILVGGPWVERLTSNHRLAGALRGVTAAVVGVVLNLGVWFAIHNLFRRVNDVSYGPVTLPVPELTTFSPMAAFIALAAGIAFFRFRMGMLKVLAGGAAMGVLAHLAGLM